jgi:hypothetical protein
MTGYIVLTGIAVAVMIVGALVFGLEARNRRRRRH